MRTNILLILLVISCFAIQILAEDMNAKIIYLEGEVKIIKAGQEVKGELNLVVNTGDKIITGEKSVCDLEFAPFTYARVGENSELTIKEASGMTKKTVFGKKEVKQINLNLDKGAVLSKLKKIDAGYFKITTPVAVVGVRGTIFNTIHSSAGTNVNVFQGNVMVTNLITGAIQAVSAGQSFNISVEGGKAKSEALAPQDVEQVKAATGVSKAEVQQVVQPQVNVIEQSVNIVAPVIIAPEIIKEPLKTTSGNVVINFHQ
ncbi:MAG TPA: FecR family protein [bacterium]|nr:FecR family protein [bacterium]HPQ20130.1 FecR family protein [bacterium]